MVNPRTGRASGVGKKPKGGNTPLANTGSARSTQGRKQASAGLMARSGALTKKKPAKRRGMVGNLSYAEYQALSAKYAKRRATAKAASAKRRAASKRRTGESSSAYAKRRATTARSTLARKKATGSTRKR